VNFKWELGEGGEKARSATAWDSSVTGLHARRKTELDAKRRNGKRKRQTGKTRETQGRSREKKRSVRLGLRGEGDLKRGGGEAQGTVEGREADRREKEQPSKGKESKRAEIGKPLVGFK